MGMANSRVVRKYACLGESLREPGVFSAPLKGAGRVVEAMDIVVVKRGARIIGWLRNNGLRGRGSGGGRGLGGLNNRGGRLNHGGGRLNHGRRRLNNRGGLSCRLGGGLNNGHGSGSRRRGSRSNGSARRHRGNGCRRGPGARAGATEDCGSVTISHGDCDPFDHDIRLDVNSAILENGAGNGQDRAAAGEEC
jgi:hypothetical protein